MDTLHAMLTDTMQQELLDDSSFKKRLLGTDAEECCRMKQKGGVMMVGMPDGHLE